MLGFVLGLVLAGGLALSPEPAWAQFPLFSVGIGGGVGGLRHEEYTGQVTRYKDIGKFSSGAWWADATFSPSGRWTFGGRIHHLSVGAGSDPRMGTLTVLPYVLTGGYRAGAAADRLRAYLGVGLGMASVWFDRSGYEGAWRSVGGGEIRISEENPFVFEGLATGQARLTEDLAAELGVAVVVMDTEVSFRPADQGEGVHAPSYGYRLEGRHVLLTAGLRWWFEWW